MHIDSARVAIVAFILASAAAVNVVVNLRYTSLPTSPQFTDLRCYVGERADASLQGACNDVEVGDPLAHRSVGTLHNCVTRLLMSVSPRTLMSGSVSIVAACLPVVDC
jgi:hypothetical protein